MSKDRLEAALDHWLDAGSGDQATSDELAEAMAERLREVMAEHECSHDEWDLGPGGRCCVDCGAYLGPVAEEDG